MEKDTHTEKNSLLMCVTERERERERRQTDDWFTVLRQKKLPS